MGWTVGIYEVAKYMTWSLILWDYLITLDGEITLFWFSRISWVKFLFFANRYIGLVLRIWDIVWYLKHPENTPEDILFAEHLCGKAMPEEASEACYSMDLSSDSALFLTMQLLVIESILIIRVWVIMGKRRQILWTLFGLLFCSTVASIVLFLYFSGGPGDVLYLIPTLIFEAIIFIAAAYHGIKVSGGMRSPLLRSTGSFRYGPEPIMRLIFKGSVLYFITVLCSLPLMAFFDFRLGVTIMSAAMNHMLLRLRKQVHSKTESVGPPEVQLTTLRATTRNRGMSLDSGEDVVDIGPYPQGR